ncbi:hypothetical protein pb186bvf_017028 [Paramecium bursaria]
MIINQSVALFRNINILNEKIKSQQFKQKKYFFKSPSQGNTKLITMLNQNEDDKLFGWADSANPFFPNPPIENHFSFSESKNKNCKLHIGNLPLNIQEETLRRVFCKFGPIKDVKIIRKNSQGQPLKDYCYGFVLMEDGDGALNAVNVLKSESPLGTQWTVAFSKDKNDDISGGAAREKDGSKIKKDIRKKEKSVERQKKTKSKSKKKKKSDSSSSSSSRGRSQKKEKKQKKKKKPSSSSDSSSSKLPTKSALVKIDNNVMDQIFSNPFDHQQSMGMKYVIKHQIHVRELFISGIPQHKQQSDIQRIFSQYGIIERVDVIAKQLVNYAYVKFKRLDQAYSAMQASAMISELLESNGQAKIYPSDPFRRVQIVGNAEDQEKDDEMLPIMFIGYPSNPELMVDEKLLKKYAEKCGGPIKGIQIVQPETQQLRSYVLIEFIDLKDCKKARRKFCRYKIQYLGDKKCDVAILSNLPGHGKKGYMMSNQYDMNMNPMDMRNRQMGMMPQQHQFQQQMPYNMPQQMMYPPMIPNLMPPQMQQQLNPNQIPQQQMGQGMQYPKNNMHQMNQLPQNIPIQPYQNQPPQMQNMNQIQQRPPYQQQQFYQQTQPKDLMMGFIPPPQQQYQQPPPQQQNYMDFILGAKPDDHQNFVWSGFMNRGRQHRVGVDARIINNGGEGTKVELPSNLEMSFKCTYLDAVTKANQNNAVVMVFTPASESETTKFQEYIQYLKVKSRAGVIQNEEFTVYVIPPGVPEELQLYNANQNEMIAIYTPK